MLELYWLKAVIAIFEVVAFEAAFVADAERRRRELDIRNAKGPKKRLVRRLCCLIRASVPRFRAPSYGCCHDACCTYRIRFGMACRVQVVGCARIHGENTPLSAASTPVPQKKAQTSAKKWHSRASSSICEPLKQACKAIYMIDGRWTRGPAFAILSNPGERGEEAESRHSGGGDSGRT